MKKTKRTTDVLIIDVISMISAKTFSRVTHLYRMFCWLQVIVIGDFYQIPPISNQLYGDRRMYCFLLLFFKEAFPHIITQNIIHQEDKIDLINCVNELEIGHLCYESIYCIIKFVFTFSSKLS